MSLMRPSVVVTLDGQRLTSAEGALVRTKVCLGSAESHDAVELTVWPSSKLAGAQPGGTLVVALSDGATDTDVWTGQVAGVRATAAALVLEGIAPTIILSRTFVSQTFLDVTVADIVRQLVTDAGVEVDEIEAGVTLPCYAVDSRRSVWSHVHDLARLTGADVTTSATGSMRFVAPAGGGLGGAASGLAAAAGSAVSVLLGGSGGLRFGANVVEWQTTHSDSPPTTGLSAARA